MGFQVFYSKWVLGLSFDIRILYLIVHDDGDSEDLDGCPKIVTIKRLMHLKHAMLIDLSQYFWKWKLQMA